MGKNILVFLNSQLNINRNIENLTISAEKIKFESSIIKYMEEIRELDFLTTDDLMKLLDNFSIEKYEENENQTKITMQSFSYFTVEFEQYNRETLKYLGKDTAPLFIANLSLEVISIDDNTHKIRSIECTSIEQLGMLIEEKENIELLYEDITKLYLKSNLLKFVNENNILDLSYEDNKASIVFKFENNKIPSYILDMSIMLFRHYFVEKTLTFSLEEKENSVEFWCAIE